ncbi:hypothetical protein L1987_35370 [Smallanthus sonchifolius]|uniref:Uncharacterized protein n=1 Tax=Smallanthus sonchifolius TaxID=185202 RepID=A0ACB9HW61_9ASTR|nr:hypothetical protein L1987_35370 [Smallanthus sonchifolius]
MMSLDEDFFLDDLCFLQTYSVLSDSDFVFPQISPTNSPSSSSSSYSVFYEQFESNRSSKQKVGDLNETAEVPVVKSACRKRMGREAEVEERETRKERKVETETSDAAVVPLTSSCWTAVWDCGDGNGKGIFEVPPLSPYSSIGFPLGVVWLSKL